MMEDREAVRSVSHLIDGVAFGGLSRLRWWQRLLRRCLTGGGGKNRPGGTRSFRRMNFFGGGLGTMLVNGGQDVSSIPSGPGVSGGFCKSRTEIGQGI